MHESRNADKEIQGKRGLVGKELEEQGSIPAIEQDMPSYFSVNAGSSGVFVRSVQSIESCGCCLETAYQPPIVTINGLEVV